MKKRVQKKPQKVKTRKHNVQDLLLYRIEFAKTQNATLFYSTNNKYGIFSNFAKLPFKLSKDYLCLENLPQKIHECLVDVACVGLSYLIPEEYFLEKEWLTTEHLFQAAKFGGYDISEEAVDRIEQIRQSPTPGGAARLGRIRDGLLRPDWEEVKKDIMFVAILMKTIQHEQMRAALLQTGQTLLVEDTVTSNDTSWGCGREGMGLNLLGKILMAIRAGLIDENVERFLTSRQDECDMTISVEHNGVDETIQNENNVTSNDSDVVDLSKQVQFWLEEARRAEGPIVRPLYLPPKEKEEEFLELRC